MKHSEFKPDAFITLSNTGGIEIMLNRSNDAVFYRFNYGQEKIEQEEIFEAEIFYGYSEDIAADEITEETESLPYFIHSFNANNPTGKAADMKYFLSDAMRIN